MKPTEKEREGFGRLFETILAASVATMLGLVGYQQIKLTDLSGDVRVLNEQMKRVMDGDVPALLGKIDARSKEIDFLSSGVTCSKGEGAPDAIVNQAPDGTWHLSANLQGSLSVAEVNCDLTSADLPNLQKNDDNSVNLAGSTLIITVQSESDFSGDPSHPNGIQLFVKDAQGKANQGSWVNASSSWTRGLPISFRIAGSDISEKAAALSVRFVIGNGSTQAYDGDFSIKTMKLRE